MASCGSSTCDVKLLDAQVDQVVIPPSQYSSLPEEIQTMAASYKYATKITITPKKSPGSGVARVHIVAANNMRSGGLQIVKVIRDPVSPIPPADQDDLRPLVLWALGTGTQKYEVHLSSNVNYYVAGQFIVH